MHIYLQEPLEKRLQQAKKNPHSLMVRVQIANQLIDNVLWYMLKVWSGDFSFLDRLDAIVQDFIWSDQEEGKKPCLLYHILLLPLEDGGLGLILIKFQKLHLLEKRCSRLSLQESTHYK